MGCRNNLWLARSHERLGDLSAAEGDWFGALHNYRYALRKAESGSEASLTDNLHAKVQAAQRSLEAIVLAPDSEILPLSREYMSGNMAIAYVHRDIFLKTYFARCLECNFCHDWCCSYGADVDIQTVETIQQHAEGIRQFIRPSTVEWFEPDYTYEVEYTGNPYTRINPQGSRCVFIRDGSRGCGLHSYALSQGMDYHEIKPLVCILFPLSFGQGILCIAPELEDNSLVCAGAGTSAYQSLRGELSYYFGSELVEELDKMEKVVISAGNGQDKGPR